MTLFISFPVSPNTKVNIAEEIGTSYSDFGILLLNDERGNKVSAIVQEHRGNAKEINYEILRLWLEGKGQPLSWSTLVQVLKDIKLNKLASEIEQALIDLF